MFSQKSCRTQRIRTRRPHPECCAKVGRLIIMKFNELIPELAVSNSKKSVKFYTNILGFSIKYQRKEDGFTFLQLGKSQLMIDEIGKGRTWKTGDFKLPFGRGINLQIQVKKIAPILKRLEQNNIKLFLEPEEKWYRHGKTMNGNKQFLVQDPDGYLLRFFEDINKRKR